MKRKVIRKIEEKVKRGRLEEIMMRGKVKK